MKKRKIRFLLCVLTLLVFCLGVPCLAENAVLVDDAAGILSAEEEQSLLSKARELSSLETLDVMVVTTDDAGGRSSEAYGDNYYLAHSQSDDGVLYLIDMDNREIHISTSGRMIDYLTDSRIEQCLDDGYSQVSNGKYAACFQAMLRDTITYVKSGEGADYYRDRDTGEIVYTTQNPKKKRVTSAEALVALLAGLLAGGGTVAAVAGKYRMKFGGYKYDYRSNHTLKLYRKSDTFRTRRVSRRHIPRNNGGGGGFSGGGSTTHSSGGHSFGGGSRKF